MPASSTVIFLNGASISGKSTLASGLQATLGKLFLHFPLDSFIYMMSEPNDAELFEKMIRGMHRSMHAMADEGNDLIVDHVLINKSRLRQRRVDGGAREVSFVGVKCSLDELERRERERGERRQGFARAQFSSVHAGKVYDLEIDTGVLSPDECVEAVIRSLEIGKPSAFERMRSEYASHTA